MKWIKRIAAALAALAALWFGLQYRKHDRKVSENLERAKALESQKVQHVAEAQEARKEAVKHEQAADEALRRGRDAIWKVEARSDSDFADRVARLNRRLRGG